MDQGSLATTGRRLLLTASRQDGRNVSMCPNSTVPTSTYRAEAATTPRQCHLVSKRSILCCYAKYNEARRLSEVRLDRGVPQRPPWSKRSALGWQCFSCDVAFTCCRKKDTPRLTCMSSQAATAFLTQQSQPSKSTVLRHGSLEPRPVTTTKTQSN